MFCYFFLFFFFWRGGIGLRFYTFIYLFTWLPLQQSKNVKENETNIEKRAGNISNSNHLLYCSLKSNDVTWSAVNTGLPTDISNLKKEDKSQMKTIVCFRFEWKLLEQSYVFYCCLNCALFI